MAIKLNQNHKIILYNTDIHIIKDVIWIIALIKLAIYMELKYDI